MLRQKWFGQGYGKAFVAAIMLLSITCTSHANFGDFFGGRSAVGGISINAEGVLAGMTSGQFEDIRRERVRNMDATPEALGEETELRRVSLRKLQEEIAKSGETDLQKLPHHLRYLAGLQRVQYVFVYPEQKDIVLVGPGEGWTVNGEGVVVGQQSQRPVMNLEDLISALRFAHSPQRHVISCSIDPTPEGMKRFEEVNASFQRRPPSTQAAMKMIEKAMGGQTITVSGIDPESRFARVLVAADYRMKRLAMGFDKVRRFPSFLSMLKSSRLQNAMPRWWLEDDYEALRTDEEGLSFELRGQGVKAMTEAESLAADGTRVGTGQADPLAKKWADRMTKDYEKLSDKAPVFAELRNCMDLAVVAALIASEDLGDRAGLDLGVLLDPESVKLPRYVAPREVPTIASSAKVRGGTAITASGGVSLNPWTIIQNRKTDEAVAEQRTDATEPTNADWFWN